MPKLPKGQPTSLKVEHAYQGPIPPPAVLEHLERVVPGAAERVLAMAEREQAEYHAHFQRVDELGLNTERDTHRENITALWMAFALCLFFSGCGTLLVLRGFVELGVTMIGVTLVGVVGAFMRALRRK